MCKLRVSVRGWPFFIIKKPFQKGMYIYDLLTSLMKSILLAIAYFLFAYEGTSQVSFSNVKFNLKYNVKKTGTDLVCTGSSFLFKFQLTTKSVERTNNFIHVDSQLIQIIPLKVNGSKKSLNNLNILEQKKLLTDYSKYELNYFINELKIEVINPNNQWVDVNSKNWLVWYFRIGSLPIEVDKKTEIQLFASTIAGGKILIINAPIQFGGDFNKVALIVNQMMKSLIINPKN